VFPFFFAVRWGTAGICHTGCTKFDVQIGDGQLISHIKGFGLTSLSGARCTEVRFARLITAILIISAGKETGKRHLCAQ
jgi:hypothetical protein